MDSNKCVPTTWILTKHTLNTSISCPIFDRLVDGTVRHQILIFLYVFSRYNQVLMYDWDVEKNGLYN